MSCVANKILHLAEQARKFPQAEELQARISALTAERADLEKKHQDCTAAADMERILADRDRVSNGKLAKEKEESLRLAAEMKKMEQKHAEELATMRSACEAEVNKQKELADMVVTQVSTTQKSLDRCRAQQKS
jgi:DNA repair exonuclease SbcCD ATPase subunit